MRKINVKQKLKISGEYEINGVKFKNVITNDGLTELAKLLIGHALPPLYIEGGYGTTTPLTIDTDLDVPIPNGDIEFKIGPETTQPYELPRKKCTVTRITEIGGDPIDENSVVINFQSRLGGNFGDNVGFPGKIEEVGMFDSPYKLINRGGVMYSRGLPPSAIITQTDIGGDMRWQLTLNKGDVSANGGIVRKALDILAHIIMRDDIENDYYNGLPTDESRQYAAKYVDFWLNTIQTGTGSGVTSESTAQLENHTYEGADDIARLTSINITPASTGGGSDFPAIIKIQRGIRYGDISEEIKEVGLFGVYRSQNHGILPNKFLWGRHVLATPIAAGEECVIQFEIELGR